MRITVEFDAENDRRYGKPWISRVTGWPIGGRPEIEWGRFLGTVSDGGICEIEAAPGDIIRYGQKDHRKPRASTSQWAVVDGGGSLRLVSEAEARDAYPCRAEPDWPLAGISDGDLLAECRRRGLSLC